MQLQLQLPNYKKVSTTEIHCVSVGEIQLSYKRRPKYKDLPKISTSRDAYTIFKRSWNPDNIQFVEQFKVLLVNRANKVIGIVTIGTGGTTACLADPKLVYAAAIKSNACSIIVSHNHPSGNVKPSQSDIELTKKLREGCKLLELCLLDHIIVSDEKYFSFADEGML